MQSTESGSALQVLRKVPTNMLIVPEHNAQTYPFFFFFDACSVSDTAYPVGDVWIEMYAHPQASAVRMQAYDRTVLMLFAPGCDLSLLPQGWLNADVLYVRSDVPASIEAEKYGFVLLQGDGRHVSSVAREICARGGEAVCNGGLRIQKDGAIGKKAGG